MTATPETSEQDARSADGIRRRGRVEQIIETLARGLGNGIGWMAENGILFAIFALIWLAFAAGLLFSQGSVDEAWRTIRGLPLLVQIAVWVLFLPVMGGLWVWESSWPLVIRLVVVAGVAGWNLLVFLPKALQAKP